MSGAFLVLTAVLSSSLHVAQSSGELIDRTLAIVAGQAITLSDVRAALTLRLLDDDGQQPSGTSATERLIERALMLREVQRYAPPEPPPAAIDARLAAVTARFASADELRAALASVAFSEVQLRAWARDDLRIAAYLDQRFASAASDERRAELVRDWIADIRRRTPVVELKPPSIK